MKKTITSAGLLILGAATLHAQRTSYAPAPGLTSTELTKPWSISASLRGFYDDNYATQPSRIGGVKNPAKDEAFGFEVSPSATFRWTLPQTYLGLSYRYGLQWYEGRPGRNYDQLHEAEAKLSHSFTERHKLEVSDRFVSAQEPELLDPAAGRLRTRGDNIHNLGNINFSADLTDQAGISVGYTNHYYDYDDSFKPGNATASYSALLDRVEHLAHVNLRWQAAPETTAIVGYQYGVVDYTSNENLFPGVPGSTILGKDRDNDSHYVFLGVDHNLNSKLQASARVGAQFTQYDHFTHEDTISPYADASLTYAYSPTGSYAMLGVRHARNATDVANNLGTIPNLDQETTTVYGSINHKFTAKLTGSALATVMFSDFQGGGVDNKSELFLLTGVNLTYDINKYLAAEVGYNFDRLDSDIVFRSYTRNRVYIGLRASY